MMHKPCTGSDHTRDAISHFFSAPMGKGKDQCPWVRLSTAARPFDDLVMSLSKMTEPLRRYLDQLPSTMSFTNLCFLGLTYGLVLAARTPGPGDCLRLRFTMKTVSCLRNPSPALSVPPFVARTP